MTPLALAGLWVFAGVAGTCITRATGHRREVWLVPALMAVVGALTVPDPGWPGPAAATSGAANLLLGRPGLGFLTVAAITIALTLLLAPGLDGGELVVACVVAGACTALLSATVPLIWGLAAAVAAGTLAVRWISVAPGPATLAAGRVGGVGASCLLGAAGFLAPAGGEYEPRAVLGGSLLAVGMCCMLALVPFGGWAAGLLGPVRGADFASWGLLLAPALVIASMNLSPQIVVGGQIPFNNALLVLGLSTMIVSGVAATRTPEGAGYGRLLIADLAFAAAGVGTSHAPGRTGAFIIVLTHLCVGPLLLSSRLARLGGQRRLAWLAVSGVPPSPAFWGRYLVLIACTATAPAAMVAGVVGCTALFFVALARVVEPDSGTVGDGERAPTRLQRVVAWATALAAIAIGLTPATIAHQIFGI